MVTKITAIIERNSDGLYSIYTEEEIKSVGIIGLHGYGSTPEEAINDFWLAYDELKEMVDIPEISVTFKHNYQL